AAEIVADVGDSGAGRALGFAERAAAFDDVAGVCRRPIVPRFHARLRACVARVLVERVPALAFRRAGRAGEDRHELFHRALSLLSCSAYWPSLLNAPFQPPTWESRRSTSRNGV